MWCWIWNFSQCEVEFPIVPHFINFVVQHYYGTQCHCFSFLQPLFLVISMENTICHSFHLSLWGDLDCWTFTAGSTLKGLADCFGRNQDPDTTSISVSHFFFSSRVFRKRAVRGYMQIQLTLENKIETEVMRIEAHIKLHLPSYSAEQVSE